MVENLVFTSVPFICEVTNKNDSIKKPPLIFIRGLDCGIKR